MNKRTLHTLIVMILDCLIICVSGLIAMTLRFEFSISAIPLEWIRRLTLNIPLECVLTIAVFFIFKLYHYVWHFVSANDVMKMFMVITSLEIVYIAITYATGIYMPKSVAFMNYVFKMLLFIAMRCSIRFYNAFKGSKSVGKDERIMIIGAGDAGNMLLREIQAKSEAYGKVCCIIDDNPTKKGMNLMGIPVVGGRSEIASAKERYDITQVIFAIPTVKGNEKKEILSVCKETGAKVKTLPGITQIVNGEVSIKELRDVEIEDLLGREPVRLDNTEVKDFVQGKVVMVTGGGGSIGSELSRQIASYHPRRLIIIDIYENNAYEIQQELKRRYGADLDLVVRIASVRDAERISQLFEEFRPEIVFHAAAHKHVPLMENSPHEAVKNNIFGTYNVVCAAEKVGVKKFVMISTDKAVNPTNVMGATKRFCEMIVQSRTSDTEFACVRFGNVLGSNGSVVPLFKKQISEGGPVTVTDKRITRFFMTIPEAVQLVLQAGAMAKKNQVFVLDMGEPVKIIDLAENLVKLSGLKPYDDIEIKEIGLRPGEKLYEELLMASEDLVETENKKIFTEEQSDIKTSIEIEKYLDELKDKIDKKASNTEMIETLQKMVPTFKNPDEVNKVSASVS